LEPPSKELKMKAVENMKQTQENQDEGALEAQESEVQEVHCFFPFIHVFD